MPLLGECPLTDLTVRKMQTFATTLASGKRTAKTIENVLLTLASILSSARKWGYKVPEVALSDLSLPRKVKVQPRYFSADEMARIVSSADEPLGTICFVLSSTGMRIGEVLALRSRTGLSARADSRSVVGLRRNVGYSEERSEHRISADAARSRYPTKVLFGLETLSPNRSRSLVRKSAPTPVLSEQITGKGAMPVTAVIVGDSSCWLPRLPARCRNYAD